MRALVRTPQGESGELSFHGKDGYLFRYGLGAGEDQQISLSMKVRERGYEYPQLHPIFQMNLPEGYLLEQLRNRFAKATTLDPMMMLSLTARGAQIGRVSVHNRAIHQFMADQGYSTEAPPKGERLDEILAWDGSEDIFAELVNKYILRAGVSGVQPKVLVPETLTVVPHPTMATPDLIVKTGSDDYPGLAINEFVCMEAARLAGIPVPEFFLSNNHQLFVMRRFDRDDLLRPLGFEDMAVLMGLPADKKYDRSYEMVVRAINLYCQGEQASQSVIQFFDMVALSCIVGNGDAHLKNFGLLYQDPMGTDARLAPAYDIVNTTAYIPEDALALNMGGSKGMFQSRLTILDLAKTCHISNVKGRIINLLNAVRESLQTHRHLEPEAPAVFSAIRTQAEHFAKTFA
ncbi:type II toxin-antitoxin system HipA family toxin [Metapseudomonas resinovorans]|uniref:Phosphatidylinositol kinase n=1 Tax=Metapseudomonas resinovorans NBRC 106553 TaxID=1245471 RepID=S6AF42_METRE|nr:type II toxin-antitoxin system HipA family toxin [Pseudomonas resinovorans]BAN48472.1 hypothetical protein PCA10_27400 [Pseudomonas resinovorans NBRC 106553]